MTKHGQSLLVQRYTIAISRLHQDDLSWGFCYTIATSGYTSPIPSNTILHPPNYTIPASITPFFAPYHTISHLVYTHLIPGYAILGLGYITSTLGYTTSAPGYTIFRPRVHHLLTRITPSFAPGYTTSALDHLVFWPGLHHLCRK